MGFASKIVDVLTGGVMKEVVGVIDKAVTDKDLAAKLKHELDVRLIDKKADLEKTAMETERDIEVEQERTHQAELNQSDIYTKRTRPKIARQSWYVSLIYALGTFVSEVLPQIEDVGFHWEVYLAMAAPALTYMGVRSFDIWKRGK